MAGKVLETCVVKVSDKQESDMWRAKAKPTHVTYHSSLLLLLFTCHISLVTVSCSYSHKFAQIGPIEYHKVNLGSVFGAGQTMIVTVNTNTGEMKEHAPIGGNGVLPSAVVAGALIGGAALISRGDYGDTVSVNQSGGSPAAGPVINNSPVINIQDPPPAPPLPAPRIKPPFGQKWR